MNNLGTISRQEWRRVMIFASGFMLITLIPYLIGWLSAGSRWEFGGFLFGADDGYSYLAKMRLGARGDWLFTIRYTAEAHDGALLFLPYILLGRLTSFFVASDNPDLPTALAITFHMARMFFGFALILVSYRFVAVFLRRPGTRMLALVLITLGGGFGWLLGLLGLGDLFDTLPVDFIVPEGYTFLILFGLPHLALARCAMLIGFLLLFRGLQTPGDGRGWLRWSIFAGLCWIVMGLCVPFYIAVVYLVLGCWGLAVWLRTRQFPWPLLWRAVIAALVVLPLLIYSTLVFATNEVMGQWSSQNTLPSPHPLHYVFGYVVLAIPAVAALRWAWKKGDLPSHFPHVLLAVWVVVMPMVVYLPINVQRRLAEGVIVPLAILAAAGLRLMAPHRRQWRRARVIMVALVVPTAILFWLGGTFNALNPHRPLFHPENELAAMDALNRAVPRDSVVLSLKETGNYLPVRTDLIAYVGHGPETIHADEKEELVAQFFAGELDETARNDLLKDVDYVFFGLLEQEKSGTLDPAWAQGLRLLPLDLPDSPVMVYEVPHD
ncbi:MAG: hypothetical protein HY866_20250 [Chloroflexi bacterium]|nr:hypothetical protein [Chloroflexota bacterium]